MSVTLGASILAADWSRLGEELVELERAGVDYVHWDAMDNRFVPNLTFGWELIADCRRWTDVEFEAHLMCHEVGADVEKYAAAGVQRLIVQPEANVHVHAVLQDIAAHGVKPGLALNPGTPLTAVDTLLDDIDTLLVMTVNPGFGGQAAIETMLPKIEAARHLIDERAPHVRLEIDGGLKPDNVHRFIDAGARAVVCGSGLFGPEGKERAAAQMREGFAGAAAL